MAVHFIHTADWQLGKPFAGIDDPVKRALLQQERFQVLRRIGEAARAHGAEFILVAGDLFDSSTPSKAVVSAACCQIGQMGLPVLAIPGNHDHGGPGGLWEQAYFRREQAANAPNLRMLLKPEPVEMESCILFPCPLLRRSESNDPTAWLRNLDLATAAASEKPRILLVHGSTQGFSSAIEEDEAASASTNQIDLSRLPAAVFDYAALGDWHGTKRVAEAAWYSGTPELDRFPKGEGNNPGNVLAVTATRGQPPSVEVVHTGHFSWNVFSFDLAEDASLGKLEEEIQRMVGRRANEDLLRLDLTGCIGFEASERLEQILDSLRARLLRLKLANQVALAPTEAEIEGLLQRAHDPLTVRVAQQLVARTTQPENAPVARLALRELFAACQRL